MNRRSAVKSVGLLTGGVFLLPYACQLGPELIYANFPLIKRKEQVLISEICNCILAEDPVGFPTPETRIRFVLTMINDCGSPAELLTLTDGFKAFEAIFAAHEHSFGSLSAEEKNKFILEQFSQETDVSDFLNLLKRYSLLHFETSENYLKTHLNYEFMPGRYYGRVPRAAS
jgi:hypothetical protein